MWTFLRLFYIIYFFNLGKITLSQIIIYSRTLNRCSQKLIFRIFCPQMMPNDISRLWILCPQFTDRSNHTVWILCTRSGNIVGHHMRTKNWKNQFCLVHTLWSIIPIIMGKSYNKYISFIIEILSYFYNDNVCFIMELTKGNSVNKQLIFIQQFESKLLFSNTCLLSKLKSFRLKHTNGYIITHWKIIHDVTCKWIPFNMAFVT